MNMLTLTSDLWRATRHCDVDGQGKVIPQETAKRFIVCTPIHIKSKDGTVGVASLAMGIVAVSKLKEFVTDDAPRTRVVADGIFRSVAKRMAQTNEWNIYGRIEVHVGEELRPLPNRFEPATDEIEVPQACFDNLTKETQRIRECEASFQRAKDYLFQRLRDPLHRDASTVKRAAQYLTLCDNAGTDPYAAYNDYDYVARMNTSIEDMIRRKNFNHQGYRSSMERAMDAVFCMRFPLYWNQSPPSGSVLSLS